MPVYYVIYVYLISAGDVKHDIHISVSIIMFGVRFAYVEEVFCMATFAYILVVWLHII